MVDDEPTLAELLSSALRYEGWDVPTVLDGQSAIRAVRSSSPDVVVLDIMLPDLDGLTSSAASGSASPTSPSCS